MASGHGDGPGIDDGARGVLVGNPGGIPEFTPMAAGLAAAGILDAYVTSVTESVGGTLGALRKAPHPLGSRTQALLSRRSDPSGIPATQIRHRGIWPEVMTTLSLKLWPPRLAKSVYVPLSVFRNRLFDRALARELSPEQLAVISAPAGSLATFTRARELSMPTFLQYPIAHHAYAQRILSEEAGRQPAFARTLQWDSLPRGMVRRMDAEIEIVDFIFGLCGFHRRSFVESGVPAEKLIPIPLGVDPALFSPRPRPDDGVFRVIFVGQIGQRKGLSYLLEAFERVALRDAELLLVGTPVGTSAPWRDRPGVTHLPPRPRAELPALYAAADVFALPSLLEGFGLTALEAMACGLPVIVSEHTFAEDLIEDGVNGFVVPIRDANAIAERIHHLHANRTERERIGAEARRTAERFSWARYGANVATAVARHTERGRRREAGREGPAAQSSSRRQ